ncbi:MULTISPECIES: NAD(P)-dependent oxidoreductase [Pseudomonas]|uniref:NAD-dependent epimerase/dehydratase family protein n=1 Tax=Pseudomonas TaxID=286 RepID=UPI000CFD3D31|nr:MULTISPECIES: NAD-dependent epimerase/dehydratase family protein [Pseudomonas]PQZ91866.1 epimerase [Pseudomonas trivialis]PRB27833.1 epimerase [Pseudomonas sp. MYb60]
MKKIAVLGASSQIAKDFILSAKAKNEYQLILFGRNLTYLKDWLSETGLTSIEVAPYENYGQTDHDVVINFVGVGNPAKAKSMGASILEVTQQYDQLVLKNLHKYPNRKYLFLSSGAVYGGAFDSPATNQSNATIPINLITDQDYYSVAKIYAEVCHRAAAPLAIVDIRVFNYFSQTQDIDARFFITDVVRSIRDGKVLHTLPQDMNRDFIHPQDFYNLVDCIIKSPKMNTAVDCYSVRPTSKYEILKEMSEKLGLLYSVTRDQTVSVNATGTKLNYYSNYHKAAEFGYKPQHSSLDTILNESAAILGVQLDYAAKSTGQADETSS